MRLVRLGRIAAQAEILRLRRLVRRQIRRGIYGAVAGVFALGLLAWLHIALALWLASLMAPPFAALIVAGVDLVIVAIFGLLAASDTPDRIEREALVVRDEARAQMTEAAVMSVVVIPILRRIGLDVIVRLIGRRRRPRP